MCISDFPLSVSHVHAWCPSGREDSAGSPGAGVTNSC